MKPSLIPTSTMLSIVVDTNQFLSGFIYHGMMKVVFDLVLNNKLTLFVSQTLKAEVLEKLQVYGINEQVQNEIMLFMETRGILVKPTVRITVCRDPEDNFVLELTETAQADYLITRDKDLLDLPNQEWKNTKIIMPEDFLPFLRKKGILS